MGIKSHLVLDGFYYLLDGDVGCLLEGLSVSELLYRQKQSFLAGFWAVGDQGVTGYTFDV